MLGLQRLLVTVALLLSFVAFGDEGSDATQAFTSPLAIGTGVTLSASANKVNLTLGLAQQFQDHFFWQIGITASSDGTGQTLLAQEGTGLNPGISTKLGLGFSSALAADTSLFSNAAGAFAIEARCLEMLSEVDSALPVPVAEGTPWASCLQAYRAVRNSFEKTQPSDQEIRREVEDVLRILEPLAQAGEKARPDLPNAEFATLGNAELTACQVFEANKAQRIQEKIFAHCPASGGEQPGIEERAQKHPELSNRLLEPSRKPPSVIFKLSVNWIPALNSAEYRPLEEGVPRLDTPKDWVGFEQAGALDFSFFTGALSGGLGLSYGYATSKDTVEVCRRVEQGEYSYEKCSKAILGEPERHSTLGVSGVLGLYPILAAPGGAGLQPGVQLQANVARVDANNAQLQLALPIFVSNLQDTSGLVFGLKPVMSRSLKGDEPSRFSLMAFIGARK